MNHSIIHPMNHSIHTRLATPADAPALALVAQQTFIDTYAEKNDPISMREHVQDFFGVAQQLAEILDPQYRNILLLNDEHIIGFAQVVQKPAPACVTEYLMPNQSSKTIALYRYYVDKAWHGKGVATSLLTAALDAAKQAQADHIWLTVWQFNPRAIAYYKKMGFTQVGETHFQFAQERQTDFVMMKAL